MISEQRSLHREQKVDAFVFGSFGEVDEKQQETVVHPAASIKVVPPWLCTKLIVCFARVQLLRAPSPAPIVLPTSFFQKRRARLSSSSTPKAVRVMHRIAMAKGRGDPSVNR
jgi:hypothetical protein